MTENTNARDTTNTSETLETTQKVPTEEDEIRKILTDNNMSKYINIFESQHLMSKEMIASLTDYEFDQIGIKLIGDRKAIRKLFPAAPMEKSPTTANSNNASNTSSGHNSKTTSTTGNTNSSNPQTVYVQQAEKKGNGVWVVLGILLCVLVGLMIVSAA